MHRLKQQSGLNFSQLVAQLPSRCLWCNQQGLHPFRNLCDSCHRALPWNNHACQRCALPLTVRGQPHACFGYDSALTSLTAPLRYSDPITRWIPDFKDRSNLYYLPLFQQLLVRSGQQLADCDRVVPVPLHWQRRLRRGFNQAELLATAVAAALQIRLDSRCLTRTGKRASQKTLTREHRLNNLTGVFQCSPLPGETLLLVDDVATTASTLQEAASCLKRAGAAEVRALVLARTGLPEEQQSGAIS